MKLMVKQMQTSITFIFQDSEDEKNIIQIVKTYREENDKLAFDVYRFNNEKNVYEKMNDTESIETVNAIFKTDFKVNAPDQTIATPSAAEVDNILNEIPNI